MLCQEGVDTYKAYCGAAREMGMQSFAKLCKDCHLIDKSLVAGDVDLIFHRVVPRGQRRIDLRKFEDALRLVAEKKGVNMCDICRAVEESRGPVLTGTRAAPVRFHDDKRTYTGTHVNGGPRTGPKGVGSAVDSSWISTLRPDPEVDHEREKECDSAAGDVQQRRFPPTSTQRVRAPSGPDLVDEELVTHGMYGWGPTVERTFMAYCWGQPSMDGKSFVKLCKDCNFLDKNLTTTEADLVFTKVLPRGQRRLDLRWFQHALWHIAERKGIDAEGVCMAVARLGRPTLQGTKAASVRFHDDKSTYTGTHVHGGPDVGPTLKASASEVWLSLLRPEDEDRSNSCSTPQSVQMQRPASAASTSSRGRRPWRHSL